MAKCWVCKEKLTDNSAVGMRGGVNKDSFVGICKSCNRLYALVRSLINLSDEELADKETKSKTRTLVYSVVKDHRDTMKTGELTKEVLRRLKDVL